MVQSFGLTQNQLTLRCFLLILVDGENGLLFYSFDSAQINLWVVANASIVFLDSGLELILNVFFFSFNKFLPYLLSVGKVPVLLKFFDSLLFNNAFEDILASCLIIQKSFLLNKMLHSTTRSLVDAVSIP
jgi:hypothetical protein